VVVVFAGDLLLWLTPQNLRVAELQTVTVVAAWFLRYVLVIGEAALFD